MERTPRSSHTLHPEPSSMPGDNRFAQRQAQAQAIDFAGEARIHAIKTLENPREMLWSNPYTMIADLDLHQRFLFVKRAGENEFHLLVGVHGRVQPWWSGGRVDRLDSHLDQTL